jgi:PP-loop superfamily ATP-utilizing enzyme
MNNKIQTSLDWPKVQTTLEAPIRRMQKYSHEMWNISHNIGLMVKELSKEEINCRRQGRQTRLHKEQVDKINEEIANYERMMTFAVLLAG